MFEDELDPPRTLPANTGDISLEEMEEERRKQIERERDIKIDLITKIGNE